VRTPALRLAAAMQGLSTETIALTLAVGLALGTFPVFGCPTVFCILAALALRLNLPALQVVNQLSSPLQILLLVPFARLGSRVLGAHGASAMPAAWRLSTAAMHAVAGWLCTCLPVGILLYFALVHILRKRGRTWFNSLESPV